MDAVVLVEYEDTHEAVVEWNHSLLAVVMAAEESYSVRLASDAVPDG